MYFSGYLTHIFLEVYYNPPLISKVHFSILLLGHNFRLQWMRGVCSLFLPPLLYPIKMCFPPTDSVIAVKKMQWFFQANI